jgi:2-polyprenyl-3-methyl-5-hydroxy-6-metoxy-1,4-benzoquinol methylase
VSLATCTAEYPPAISPGYVELNRKLHEANPNYGSNGHRSAPMILQHAMLCGATTALDYGCGKGTLAPVLRANGLETDEYDPAVPGKDNVPRPADIVYCGDVAEHVEPEYLTAFLDDLKRVTKKRLVIVVATRPAMKSLEDGRNAHLIVEPLEWWLPKLRDRFDLVFLQSSAGEFTFIGDAHHD